jgi:bacillithiol biosynthesis cysteine-adding enzyme BshC
VPVFWLATEDHDFAEVNHFWGFDRENRPAKLEMNRPAFGQPVGGIELLNPPIEGLESLLEGFPFAGEVASLVRRCYTPGRTMGAAFRDLLKELLAGFDLIYVDPMSPRLRELAAPAMRAALENAPELTNAVLERNAELRAAGYHAQVHVEEHTSFVFLLEGGQRLALRRQGNEYVRNGRRFNTEELSARAEQLSPNALLRPVIQDSILPTVAYVGGPAELAYLAQAEVIYRAVLGRMPVAVPRKSFTILDQRSRKLMRRYNLTLEDFFIGEDALRELVAARLIPPELSQAIATTRDAVSVAIGRLSADLQGFDVTLKKALQKSRAKIEHQLSKIEGKVGREAMIRDARASRDAACLYGLIYPDKHLQERLYSILPFLARHGPDLVEHLYENLHLDCPDHQLVVA